MFQVDYPVVWTLDEFNYAFSKLLDYLSLDQVLCHVATCSRSLSYHLPWVP